MKANTVKKTKKAVVAAPMARFDTAKAAEYGVVTYLFDDHKMLNAMSGQAAMRRIMSRMRDIEFDPREDAIVMTGQVSIVAMLVLAAWDCLNPVRALIFDARDGGSYRLHLIDPRDEVIQ